MTDEAEPDVPEGAAVFPLIPPELGINPLLLAVLHAIIFLAGSEDDIVHAAAADEAVQYLAGYLQRLEGAQLERVREDIDCLVRFAKQEKWPKQLIVAVKTLLEDMGIQ